MKRQAAAQRLNGPQRHSVEKRAKALPLWRPEAKSLYSRPDMTVVQFSFIFVQLAKIRAQSSKSTSQPAQQDVG
jgi:hypothetical protein